MSKLIAHTSTIKILLQIIVLATLIMTTSAQEQSNTFRNPLNSSHGADPWIVYHDGYYYLATTTGASHLTMRKSPTLAGLKTAEIVTIYAETERSRSHNMWAPEFYLLDGPNGLRWYYYYSAGTVGTHDNQRTHVLESEGTDPMGPYHYKERIFDPDNDTWAIDGSVLTLDDSLYFLFSAWVGDNQQTFIAPMSDPWTISGSRVLIATPSLVWERHGWNVNEGAVALQHDGRTFVIYSASGCATPEYKLGMLELIGDDPLDSDSWFKYPEPVFQQSEENSVFGPGHNGFFKSPDGTEDWIVYHANDRVSGGCDDGRTTRAQKFTWNDDGTPNFGVPASSDMELASPSGDEGGDPLVIASSSISRFKSYRYQNSYISHIMRRGQIDSNLILSADAEFIVRPGLADAEAISLESISFPNHYLRHTNGQIWLGENNGSDEFTLFFRSFFGYEFKFEMPI